MRLSPVTADRIRSLCREHLAPVEEQAPMSRYTSAGVGGQVPFVIQAPEARKAARLAAELRGLEEGGEFELRPLGNGTNLLVDDGGGAWVVLHFGGLGTKPRLTGHRVTAPAGMSLPYLVRNTIEAGLRGLEHAEGIPGTVGGSVAGNAGCYGGDMGRVVRHVHLLRDGRETRLEVGPADFGYRCSPVQSGDIVLEVEMELEEDDVEAIKTDRKGYRRRRLQSQPIGQRSAGCVFKNPEGDSAGRLIDAAGLKNTSVGGARVSEVHANFLVNDGGATAADFLALIEQIQETVQHQFGIGLETEIQVWQRETAA